MVAVRGGPSRRVGRVRGRSVDWQPVLPFGACTPPPGSRVVASSSTAVVSAPDNAGEGNVGWYGCLRAVGQRRLLTSTSNDCSYGYCTSLVHVSLTGRYAALEFTFFEKASTYNYTIDVYDVGTGNAVSSVAPTEICADLFAEAGENCGIDSFGLDSLVLDSSGFTAWHTTGEMGAYSLTGVSCPSGPAVCRRRRERARPHLGEADRWQGGVDPTAWAPPASKARAASPPCHARPSRCASPSTGRAIPPPRPSPPAAQPRGAPGRSADCRPLRCSSARRAARRLGSPAGPAHRPRCALRRAPSSSVVSRSRARRRLDQSHGRRGVLDQHPRRFRGGHAVQRVLPSRILLHYRRVWR